MENQLISFLEGCSELPLILKYLIVIAIGFMPILEIRGAAVAGMCALDLGIVETYICGLIGNILLIFPIVILGRKLILWLETTKILGWFGRWMSKRTEKKLARMRTITWIGLFLFVAIPLPGTGVCTAGLIASFMNLRLRQAFSSLALGAAVAGVVSFAIYALPLFASMYPGTPMPWFR